MKNNRHLLLITIIALTLARPAYANLNGVSFLSIRPQSNHPARTLTLWPYWRTHCINQTEFTCNALAGYTHSFHPHRMSQALFGTDILEFAGKDVTPRGPCAIVADQFGLSSDFHATAHITPVIATTMLDLNFFASFSHWCEGLYASIHAPIASTKWKFRVDETPLGGSENTPFPALYMDDGPVTPIGSIKQALDGTARFGQMQTPLEFGKITGSHTKSGVSDVTLVIGWHPYLNECQRTSISAHLVIPTGNRPEAEFFFEPTLGNRKQWQLGLGLAGDWLLWEKNDIQEIRLYGDAVISHLFASTQRRSFDFCPNGFGSRFLLMKEFNSIGNYTSTLVPAINHSTRKCKVRINLDATISFMACYSNPCMHISLGYSGWIRSKEKITLKQPFPENIFGFKGLQNVAIAPMVPSNATQRNVTLFSTDTTADMPSPRLISPCDLDLDSAASPRLVTHTFFFHISRSFISECLKEYNASPFFGIGCLAEFQDINPRIAPHPEKVTMAQWGFWGSCGVSWS